MSFAYGQVVYALMLLSGYHLFVLYCKFSVLSSLSLLSASVKLFTNFLVDLISDESTLPITSLHHLLPHRVPGRG